MNSIVIEALIVCLCKGWTPITIESLISVTNYFWFSSDSALTSATDKFTLDSSYDTKASINENKQIYDLKGFPIR